MTTYATTGRPSWAVTAWVDDRNVYVELPAKEGPPFITSYPLTEAGLSQALNLMRNVHRDHAPLGGSYKYVKDDRIKTKLTPFTDDQRAKAQAVLKRLKIT